LAWPRRLFRSEAAALVNNTKFDDWADRCELLLEDSFVGVTPRDEFLTEPAAEQRSFLIKLLRRAEMFREAEIGRPPYWSERRRSKRPGSIPLDGTVREFMRVVNDLDRRGYFEQAFDKDCVDAPADPERPSRLLARELGVSDLWPLNAERLIEDQDLFAMLLRLCTIS
jgi:hypothetical protein